jgi:hypothetical protein
MLQAIHSYKRKPGYSYRSQINLTLEAVLSLTFRDGSSSPGREILTGVGSSMSESHHHPTTSQRCINIASITSAEEIISAEGEAEGRA